MGDGYDPCRGGGRVAASAAQCAAAPVQCFARVGGLRPQRLPATFRADQPIAGAVVREASRGGLDYGVYDGGLQPPVYQGALRAVDAGGAAGSVAEVTMGKATG